MNEIRHDLRLDTAFYGLLILLTMGLGACSSPAPRTEPPVSTNIRPATDGPGNPALLGTIAAEQPVNLPKSRYGNPDTYTVFGKQYQVMHSSSGYREEGIASWYGAKFHGRKTSSGEPYNMYGLTAAHKHLPLPTFVKVTNLENGRQLVVKVNDRGPFHDDRIIDLSYGAAASLGVLESGTAPVRVEALTDPAAVTTTAANESSAASTPADTGNRPRVIQVGAFGERGNAEKVRQKINQIMQVDAAYIVASGEQSLYKVRFGVASDAPLPALLALLERAGIDKYAVLD